MHLKWIVGGIVGIVVLGFGYYAISPLFNTIKVNDPLPQTTVAGENQSVTATTSTVTNDEMSKNDAPAEVTGTIGHPASGTVRIVAADGKKYVRYENFKTINGPDIYVYLSKDLGAKEYISLGKVTATEGNINYEIPGDINPSDYKYVLTWCKTFGVLFNSGQINQQEWSFLFQNKFQLEDGKEDHKILAVPLGESWVITEETQQIFKNFTAVVFSHLPNKIKEVGRFLGKEDALLLISKSKK